MNGRIALNWGGIGRKAQVVLLFALAFVLAVPVAAHADTMVAETKDTNADGHLDRIDATVTPTPSQWAKSDFSVTGYTVSDVALVGSTFQISLTPKNEFDTGATPGVSFKGTDATPQDKAGPVLVEALGDDQGGSQMFNFVGDKLTLKFSEPPVLYVSDPQGAAPPAKAQDTVDSLLALEQGVIIGPANLQGCGSDGDGTYTVTGTFPNTTATPKRNFPAPSISAGHPDPNAPELNPLAIANNVITIQEHSGNDGSGIGYAFGVTPQSVSPQFHCTANIAAPAGTTTYNKSIQDTAGNFGVQKLGGGALITHAKGEALNAQTIDANANGKIDGVAVSFNHLAKLDSVTRAISGGRFSISTGSLNSLVNAQNLHCDACASNPTGSAASMTVSFDEVAAWATATTPSITYDGSGDCVATGVVVALVNNYTECADGFSKVSVDAARPVILQAKTRDLGDPTASPVANGKLDAVEVTFSEPVSDASISGAGFALSGYTVNGFHTGAAANDAVVLLRFSEVAVDTDHTSALTYTQPGGVNNAADANGNLLNNISAPGVNVSDGAGPALVSGAVLDTGATPDGKIDTAQLTFSEPVLSDAIFANKLTIAGVPANTATIDAADSKIVNAVVTAGVNGTDAKDLGTVAGAVFDNAGNGAPVGGLAAANVQDLAKPVIVNVTPRGQNGSSVPVTLTFSEPMDTNQALAVKYGLASPYDDVTIAMTPDDSTHKNGFLTADSTKWEGTAPVPDGGSQACLDPTGCENRISVANAKAAAGDASALANAYEPDTRYTWTIDTVAPAQPPAFTAPASGAAFSTSGTTRDVAVSGTSTEPNLTIQVYEGDTLRGTALSNSTGNWSANLATLGLGAHALKLRAVDAGGNASGYSGLRTVYVKQTTVTTLGRNYGALTYGNAVTFSGTLKNAGGGALSNRTVALQYIPAGTSSWRTLANLKTNSSGAYSYAIKPSVTATYRAVYGGESTFMNSVSPLTSVGVRTAVSSAQSATSIRYGSTVTFTGGVAPSKAYKKIYLQVQNANKTWSNIGYVYLDRYSHYKVVYKPTVRGTRYYRLYYPKQDGINLDGWSVTRRIAVS